MKTIFLLTALVLSTLNFSFAQTQDCSDCGAEMMGLPSGNLDFLSAITAQERRQFMARNASPAGWTLGLRIESNFRIPIVGSQNYFGRIFFKRGENHIQYRDEQIARQRYDEERNGGFYTSRYQLSEINSRNGKNIAPGVRIIGQNLNSTSGGRLTIAVNSLRVPIDIAVSGNRAIPSMTVNGRRIVFDTMKLNARTGGIIRGLSNVQLIHRGQVVHTITN